MKTLTLLSVLLLSITAHATEYKKVADCDGGAMVIDRYRTFFGDSTYATYFQIVIRNPEIIAYFERAGIRPDFKGEAGDWIFKDLQQGASGKLFERLTPPHYVNVSRPSNYMTGEMRFVATNGNEAHDVTHVADWTFRDCTLAW